VGLRSQDELAQCATPANAPGGADRGHQLTGAEHTPDTRAVFNSDDCHRAFELRDAIELLARLREWLDFAMWFLIEHPHDQQVRYDWFVVEYPEGTPERERGLQASNSACVLDFVGRCQACTPVGWAVRVLEDEKERGVAIGAFASWLRGELDDLVRAILKKSGELPPWFPRKDIFPAGKTLADAHADYLAVRQQVLGAYARLAAKSPIAPPCYAFPDAVPFMQDHPGAPAPKPPGAAGGTKDLQRLWSKDYCPNCGQKGIEYITQVEFETRARAGGSRTTRKTAAKKIKDGRYCANPDGKLPWCIGCAERTPEGAGQEVPGVDLVARPKYTLSKEEARDILAWAAKELVRMGYPEINLDTMACERECGSKWAAIQIVQNVGYEAATLAAAEGRCLSREQVEAMTHSAEAAYRRDNPSDTYDRGEQDVESLVDPASIGQEPGDLPPGTRLGKGYIGRGERRRTPKAKYLHSVDEEDDD